MLKSSPVTAEQAAAEAAKAEPAEQAAAEQAKAEEAEPKKITKDTPFDSSLSSCHKSHNSPPQTVVNVYKNYVPLALLAGAVGVYIFAKFAKIGGSENKHIKRITPSAQPSTQPSAQPSAQPASASLLLPSPSPSPCGGGGRRQPEIDPFEMR